MRLIKYIKYINETMKFNEIQRFLYGAKDIKLFRDCSYKRFKELTKGDK